MMPNSDGAHSEDSGTQLVHVPNMGPTWVLSAPDGPHVGPINIAIGVVIESITGLL